MSHEEAAVRALVHGRVQGVGFRFFIQDVAVTLGLAGYTRNLPNGAVEVVAEGTQAAMDALLASLRRGPSLARVDRVDVAWAASTGAYEGFAIR